MDGEAMTEYLKVTEAKRLGGYATTAERNEAIAQAYRDGAISPEIAARFGITRQRVWQILKRRGVAAHYRMAPSAEALLELIEASHMTRLQDVSDATGMSVANLRTRLKKHPRWPEVRQQMMRWRATQREIATHRRVVTTYRSLERELGHIPSLKEMSKAGIHTTTLSRIYGTSYVRKFREHMTGNRKYPVDYSPTPEPMTAKDIEAMATKYLTEEAWQTSH